MTSLSNCKNLTLIILFIWIMFCYGIPMFSPCHLYRAFFVRGNSFFYLKNINKRHNFKFASLTKANPCQRKTFLSQRLIIPTLFSNICINYIPLMTQTIHLYDADCWCFLRFVSKHTPSQWLPWGRRLHTDMNYSSLDWLCIYWNIFLTASKTKTR